MGILVMLTLQVSAVTVDEVRNSVREALRPEVRAQLAALENSPKKAKKGMLAPDYTTLLCDWIARISTPVVTNNMLYFRSWHPAWKSPEYDLEKVKDLAAQLNGLPPLLKISLGYGSNFAQAVPGVDYPGVEPEDAGSTPEHLRIALCCIVFSNRASCASFGLVHLRPARWRSQRCTSA